MIQLKMIDLIFGALILAIVTTALHGCAFFTAPGGQTLLDATTIASCTQASNEMTADQRKLAVRQLELCRSVLLITPTPAATAASFGQQEY